MKLRLRYFRKYIDITLDLGDKVTKISGESGSGKSTILDAIFWCLYGKIQKVGTREGNTIINGKTEVTIEMPFLESIPLSKSGIHLISDTKNTTRISTLQVHRTSQKNVTVVFGDQQFTGETAQIKINDYFLPHTLFTMTSYMRAEMSHPLLVATPAEKRELTSHLFPDASKYDSYRNKLLEIRHRDNTLLSTVKNKIIALESSIQTMEETHLWIKNSEVLSNDLPDEKLLVDQIKKLQRRKEDIQRLITSYNSLTKQLSSLPEPINTHDNTILESELVGIKSKLLQSTVDSRTKENKIKFIQSRLDDGNKALSTLLTSLGQQTFDIQECTRIMNVCEDLLSIANSVSDLDTKIKDTSEEHTKESTLLVTYEKSLEDIEYNSKLENILVCPCCNNKLQHIDGLVVFNGDAQHRHVEHHVTMGDIQKQRLKVDKLDERKQSLMKQYNKYQEILRVEDMRTKGVSLRNLDLKSYKSKLQEYARLFREKELIEKDLRLIQDDTREYITLEEKGKLEARQKELTLQTNTAIAVEIQRTSLNTQIKALLDKVHQEENNMYLVSTTSFDLKNPSLYVQEIDTSISTKQDELIMVRAQREKSRLHKIYTGYKSSLDVQKKEQDALTKRIDASHKTESLLASVYNEYVGIKLKELEYDVCMLGKTFFDDTMNITLLPGKESSTGTIKPSFDVQIEYGNILYDDIKAMSTGERKRLSIIFNIVLTKYLDGKILLLDEALYSVGLDTRGTIMNEISRLEIPTYLTSHDELAVGIVNELKLDDIKIDT